MSEASGIRNTRLRRAAAVVSVLWTGLVLAYAAGYVGTLAPEGFALVLALAGFAAAILVPVALAFALAGLGGQIAQRESRIDELEARLRKAEKALDAQDKRLGAAESALKRLAEAPARVAPAPQTEAAPAPAPEAPAPKDEPVQADLPLEGGSDRRAEVSLSEAIRALNFPQDAQDRDGFAVLRRALADQELARLLQAAEDCLNLLAHQGLYMDDVFPAPASAEDWRQFARGGAARAALMPLNGIRDVKALETVRSQMRADPIFRDAALYFQRRFDQLLNRVAPEATDAELLDLVDTRSGRAFVLLVQASGMRDAPAASA